jgi:hypothetical protein
MCRSTNRFLIIAACQHPTAAMAAGIDSQGVDHNTQIVFDSHATNLHCQVNIKNKGNFPQYSFSLVN